MLFLLTSVVPLNAVSFRLNSHCLTVGGCVVFPLFLRSSEAHDECVKFKIYSNVNIVPVYVIFFSHFIFWSFKHQRKKKQTKSRNFAK